MATDNKNEFDESLEFICTQDLEGTPIQLTEESGNKPSDMYGWYRTYTDQLQLYLVYFISLWKKQ